MSARALFDWQVADPAARRAPGRPGRTLDERFAAMLVIARVEERERWKLGWRRVRKALEEEGRFLPVRLVQETLRGLKRARRAKRAHILEAARVGIEVLAQDALWTGDATHLGRAPSVLEPGARVPRALLVPVQAEVLREVATQRTLALSVGAPAHSAEVIALFEQAYQDRLVLPLVWASDNGPAYISRELETWLAAHEIVHLKSLPHTPQHNPWSERGMRELKEASGLGEGIVLAGTLEAELCLRGAQEHLNHEVQRESLGWLTPDQASALLAPWYTRVCRGRFYQSTCQAIESALAGIEGARARRRAEREAILASMERFGLIRRTRGGRPYHLVKPEVES